MEEEQTWGEGREKRRKREEEDNNLYPRGTSRSTSFLILHSFNRFPPKAYRNNLRRKKKKKKGEEDCNMLIGSCQERKVGSGDHHLLYDRT